MAATAPAAPPSIAAAMSAPPPAPPAPVDQPRLPPAAHQPNSIENDERPAAHVIGGPLPKQSVQIRPSDFKQGDEYYRNIWLANPTPETSYERLFEEDYWAHIADRGVRPWDKIEVRHQGLNGGAYVELLVVGVGRGFVRVIELLCKTFDTHTVAGTVAVPDYEVEFTPSTQYRVVRCSDHSVMQDNLVTREAAYGWIANHMQSGRAVRGR